MHIITAKRLKDFWEHHPDAESALRSWILMLSSKNYLNHNQLKIDFPTASILDSRKIVFILGTKRFAKTLVLSFPRRRESTKAIFANQIIPSITSAETNTGLW